MHDLQTLLHEKVISGLKRQAITTCADWSERYRVMGEPIPGQWSFKYHPWLREIHNSAEEDVVIQKAAQMGVTEAALNKAFYSIDMLGRSVLYILPAATPDAGDFSSSRFDPALELSPHLNDLFSDVKNVGHKRAGAANLFIRGSRSRSQLKSVPVSIAIADEYDEMNRQNVSLIWERLSGQIEKQFIRLSTPTIENVGINLVYKASTQDQFFFKCPHCSRFTQLIFPECIVISAEDFGDSKILDSYLKCKECDHELDHKTKSEWLTTGEWVSERTDRLIKGFHINQLYSSTVKPYEIAISYLKGEIDPTDEQEHYNSKLGEPHEVDGARITDTHIKECTGSHKKLNDSPQNALVTMGIDVGKWIHYEIDQWFLGKGGDINLASSCRILDEGKVLNFEDLDALMHQFRVRSAVIDANPEKRKALEFAQRFYGIVKLCIYARGVNAKQIVLNDKHGINIDRTSWMDLAFARFKTRKIILPLDLSLEYKRHIKTPVRIYEKDQDGNPVGKYVIGENEDDHLAHARVYSEVALPIAVSLGGNQDISNIL